MKRLLLTSTAMKVLGVFALVAPQVHAKPGQAEVSHTMTIAQATDQSQQGAQGRGSMIGQRMMGSGMMMGPGMGSGLVGPGGYDAERAAEIKEKLAITEKQEPAWTAYSDALAEATETMRGMHDNMAAVHDPEMSIDDRLALMDSMHATGREAFKTVETARMKLFAVLSDEQAKEAQTLLPTMGPGMGVGMMMMGPRSDR